MRRRIERRRRFIRFSAALTVMLVLGAAFLSVRSFAGTESSAMARSKIYKSITIEKGDTMGKIADRYITDEYSSRKEYISEVVTINHIENADSITAGTHLIVPFYTETVTR